MPEAGEAGTGTPARHSEPRWPFRNVQRVVVEDESMQPTLRPGDRLLVDRRAYRDRGPRVGDIVVLGDPEQPGRWLVKRIAAVGPGQYWKSRTGPLPAVLPGTEEAPPPGRAVESVSLSVSEVYVLGDAPESRDSHQFGPVRSEALVGRAYRCYSPADRRRAL